MSTVFFNSKKVEELILTSEEEIISIDIIEGVLSSFFEIISIVKFENKFYKVIWCKNSNSKYFFKDQYASEVKPKDKSVIKKEWVLV